MQTKDGKQFTAFTPFSQLAFTEQQNNSILRWCFAFIIAGFSFLYLLPFAIAFGRKRTNTAAIFIVNLLFGWTLLGWVLALVWAVKHDDRMYQAKFQYVGGDDRPLNSERD